MAITAPRGTQDILPSESYKWQFLEQALRDAASLFGFNEIRTPVFEHIDLFCRGVGDGTDIVQKEMYEVKAQKGEDIYALKPEGTAGVVRSAIERGLLNDALPQKLYYITPCFRHERPQAGRYREFHQFGCECFGSASPSADVEIISMVFHIIKLLGLRNISLHLNSIGCPTCRGKYKEALKAYFLQHNDILCGTCHERLDKNPMRILDCKSPECGKIAKNAPVMLDFLCAECDNHFNAVKAQLTALGFEYEIDTKIVRGLDYYTKTVFEFISSDLGAQATVFGGGRYDGLVEALGGKAVPALGFGMGIERLLLSIEAQGIELPDGKKCDLYIGSIGEKAAGKAELLTCMLRDEGFFVECDLMERSVKAQMKYANKINAQMSIVLGENEIETGKASVKDMGTGEQKEINFETELKDVLYDAMLAREADMIAEQLGDNAFENLISMQDV